MVGFLDNDNKAELEKELGIVIVHNEIFEQALIHRSYLQVLSDDKILSNERLEFLGDAILGFVTAEYLFSLHSDVLEGELTKMRSWLVNKNTLAICARRLNLDKYLKLSYSAEKSLQQGADSILADTLEAIIAAIYLDQGAIVVTKFITDSLFPIMLNESIMKDKNYKSLLLEEVQAVRKEAPKYSVLEEFGPDHDKEFIVGVFVDDVCVGKGSGKNKKQAEQNAAKEALKLYK